MSTVRQTMLLARREFLERVRTRAFIITMAILTGAVLVSGPVISLLGGEDEPISIALVGTEPAGLGELLPMAAERFGAEVDLERPGDVLAAEEALRDGRFDVALVDGVELVWHEEPSFFTGQIIQSAITMSRQQVALDELDATAEQRSRLLDPPPLRSRTLVADDPNEEPRLFAAFAALFVLYIAILVFGQFVAMGTVQEKQNRVIEVLLAKVSPTQVLVGKVVGIGLLGLGQLIALGLAGIATLTFVDTDLELPSLGLSVVGSALLWFVLGYTLYAFVYAALGATVSRQEDLQGVLIAPLLLLIPGYAVAQFAAADGTSALARWGSLFPFWSPIMLPSRLATGDAGWGEHLAAIVLVMLSIYGLARLGGRVYAGALMRTGGRVSLRDAWRSAGG